MPKDTVEKRGKYPEDKIGKTSFKKLEPQNVRKVSETSRRTCLCTACSNVALKAKAIKAFVSTLDDQTEELRNLTHLTKYKLADASVCQYDNYPQMACLDRTCEGCRNKLGQMLRPLLSYKDSMISWCHWEYADITKDDTTKKVYNMS